MRMKNPKGLSYLSREGKGLELGESVYFLWAQYASFSMWDQFLQSVFPSIVGIQAYLIIKYAFQPINLTPCCSAPDFVYPQFELIWPRIQEGCRKYLMTEDQWPICLGFAFLLPDVELPQTTTMFL